MVKAYKALGCRLLDHRRLTWNEWAETLGAELKAAADRGEPDDGSHYYEHWLGGELGEHFVGRGARQRATHH